ncbi:MAG: RidA family protein [Bryobacterales bacterium]|nr:RidA family protein [Bryobacterales bacterium]
MKTTVLTLLFALAVAAGAAEKKVIVPDVGPKPVGPYSPGIFVGEYLYTSGQGARDPEGRFASTFEGQARQCFRNVQLVVEAAGLTMEHVVYTQVYLDKSENYKAFDQVWSEFFPKNPPARATIGVYRMPTNTPIEISAVAIRDLKKKKAIVPPGYPAHMALAPAILVDNDRLYLSGFLGRDVNTGRVPDDPAEQVQLSLNRLRETLKAAGMDFRNMVFVNPYLTEKMPMNIMNEVYAKHFEFGNTPARATIRVNSLPNGANIEFTGIAVRDLKKRRAVRPKNMAPSPTASACVWAGDTYYCSAKSGFIPGPNSGIYAESVENQVRQTMRNLLDGLEEAGLNFSHVVKSNVYVDNLDEFQKMNAVYGSFFKDAPPTRTTVQPVPPVTRQPDDRGRWPKLEEISIIAVKP